MADNSEKEDGRTSSKANSLGRKNSLKNISLRPVSSESRPQSSGSFEGVPYESIKRKKKKGTKSVEGGYKVTFNVTVAQAINTGGYTTVMAL